MSVWTKVSLDLIGFSLMLVRSLVGSYRHLLEKDGGVEPERSPDAVRQISIPVTRAPPSALGKRVTDDIRVHHKKEFLSNLGCTEHGR